MITRSSALQLAINNTAAGFEALYSDTAGSENTATGYEALFSNTTGDDNTATGYEVLLSNTTGYANTADAASQIQKVSAQFELSKSAPQMAGND